jgi:hypothetical protein
MPHVAVAKTREMPLETDRIGNETRSVGPNRLLVIWLNLERRRGMDESNWTLYL